MHNRACLSLVTPRAIQICQRQLKYMTMKNTIFHYNARLYYIVCAWNCNILV